MAITKIQTGLRLDEITYSKLKFLAECDGRSLNNLVEFVLKRYLADYEDQNGEVPVPPLE